MSVSSPSVGRRVVPIVRAESLIPHGPYCYTPREAPSRANNGSFLITRCPFWSRRAEQPEQLSGWCSYLRRGDNEDDGGLLWDQVKACGVKVDDDAA